MGWQKRKNPETVGQAILGTYFSSLASVSWFMSACVHAKSLQSCLTLWDTMDHSLLVSSLLCDSPGKNTGVGCHALLQGIFPTQGSNPGLPYCRRILYQLHHQRSYREDSKIAFVGISVMW